MATTYNFTDGSISGQPKVNDTLPNSTGIFCRSNIVDFANQSMDVSETDVAQIINIPADTWVLGIGLRIITSEGASAVMDIGSDLDVDQWYTGAATATGNLATTWAAEYFSAANTVDITSNSTTDYDGLKVEVVAIMLPGNKSDNDGGSSQST